MQGKIAIVGDGESITVFKAAVVASVSLLMKSVCSRVAIQPVFAE